MLSSSTYKFLFNLGREKLEYIFAGVFLSISITVLNVLSTLLLIPLIALFLQIESLEFYTYDNNIVQYLFSSFYNLINSDKSWFSLIIIWVIIIVKNCIVFFDSILNIKHNKYLVQNMRIRGLKTLANISIDYYQKNKTGDILLKLNREIDRAALHLKSCQKIFTLISIIFLLVCFLLSISWQLTIVCIILLWLFGTIKKRFILWTKKLANISTQKSTSYTRKVVDLLTGIQFIKSIANEKSEYLNIVQTLRDKDKLQFKTQILSTVINPISEIAGTALGLSLVTIGYYLYRLPLQAFMPIIVTFFAVLLRLLPFLSQLENARNQFANSRTSAENIVNFLAETKHDLAKSGTTSFTTIDSAIKFINVTFAYPNHGQIILDKVNFSLNSGKNTAIIGTTETEKVAIIELLLRFYDPIEGKVIVNQDDIQTYNLSHWRKSIAIINNNIFLFHNSIANNIVYGLEDISETALIAVLKQVNLHHLIDSFPQGLATEIGIQGVTLTEVQRQKIAIARAILRNPEFLIINESSLAPELLADPMIQRTIAQLYCDRTSLVLTDKLTTLKNADQVVMLNKGMVVESGTHAELLNHRDFYHRWYSKQFKISQQLHQHKLVQKIAKKLAHQTNNQLSTEISQNLDALHSCIQLVNEATFKSDHDQEKILDESYQSAQELLASLREYKRKITASLNDDSNILD